MENKGLLTEIETVAVLLDTLGTKLKFESKITDQDRTAFKDEMRIELHAISQAQRTKTLAKIREVVEGAGLTDGQMSEIAYLIDDRTTMAASERNKQERRAIAQAQLQAILKAIDKEDK